MKKSKKKRIKEHVDLLKKINAIYSQNLEERIGIDKAEVSERIGEIVRKGGNLFEEGKARGVIIATDEITGFTMANGRFKTIEQLAEMLASFICSTRFNYGVDSLKLMELITKEFIRFDERAEKDILKKLDGWT